MAVIASDASYNGYIYVAGNHAYGLCYSWSTERNREWRIVARTSIHSVDYYLFEDNGTLINSSLNKDYSYGTNAALTHITLETGTSRSGLALIDWIRVRKYASPEPNWGAPSDEIPIDIPPTASFTYTPEHPTANTPVLLSDTSMDSDGSIVAWYWDFGDYYYSSLQNPQHCYDISGTYNVTLTAIDNGGKANTTSETLVVTNQPNTPDNPTPLNGAQNILLDSTLTWTGGDPDQGETVTYDVYFGSSNPPSLASNNQAETSFSPGPLLYSTTYFWQIVAHDSLNHTTTGPIWQFTTILDTTPPNTNLSLQGTNGENGWYLSPVTAILTSEDSQSGVNGTYYEVDDGPWTLYTAPFTISENGQHIVLYYSIDNHGNTENAKYTILKIDATPPETSHAFSGTMGNNSWYTSPVTITLTATDNDSGINKTYYKIDTENWTIYTAPITISSEETNTLQYYSIDLAGNTESIKGPYTFNIDKTAPTTTHAFSGTQGANDWYTSNVTITLTTTDTLPFKTAQLSLNTKKGSSGVNHTYYQLDDANWTEYTAPIIVLEDGTHTLNYYSVDKAGNIETMKGPFTFKIDQTPPIVTLTATAVNTMKTKWNLTAEASDSTSGMAKVEFYVDGVFQGTINGSGPYRWTYQGDGKVATAVAYDISGNCRTSDEVTVLADVLIGQSQGARIVKGSQVSMNQSKRLAISPQESR